MTAKTRLCQVGGLAEGEPQLIETDGGLSLAVFLAGGEVFVTDAMCTHGLAVLTDGYQEDFVIECPLHGGSFDIRTGAALTAPCEIAVKTYPVSIDDGWVTVAEHEEEA